MVCVFQNINSKLIIMELLYPHKGVMLPATSSLGSITYQRRNLQQQTVSYEKIDQEVYINVGHYSALKFSKK